MSASADRNLLFGILAVQLDFVTRDQLVAGMNAWLLDKHKPLGDLLRDHGHLSPERLQLLAALVAEHLKQHGGDPQRSLAALSSVPPTLKQQLAALPDEAVQQSIACVGAVQPSEPDADPNQTVAQPLPPPTAVRYRILRPHARGGLGEVFVAEDTELGRSVALKEIQNRYADDRGSRERFVREAEITGGLEHPGIVPVYGLGTYDDGRPFYAMRFIKGDNLKAAIKRFHATPPRFDSLEFRQLLRRFNDVCNAVAYAHSRGVLHRDLKPGNIMLGKYGETLVVDWGLAKPLGRSDPSTTDADADATLMPRSSGESSATVMGQAMGTPAYMSPEQAAGKLDELGPATDIYSLGATLYELLAGRVPFPELDLDAVQKGRFPPPRAVNPAVPRPLEAVCLKGMARTPADRYASALDLAKEVERWLADEPVTAWREPVGARARRWVRKHSRQATAAGAALTVGAAALGLLAVERERARGAVAAEQALTARERDEKEAERQRATTERDRAVAARQLTREALNAMVSDVTGDSLATQKALSREQKKFLESVLTYYKEFAAEPGQDREGRQRLAMAHFRLGVIRYRLGHLEEGAAVFGRAVDLYGQLAADFPAVPAYRRELANSHYNLGILLSDLGKWAKAEAAYRAALAAQEKLAAEVPTVAEYRGDLASSHNSLGNLLADLVRRADAEAALRAALAIREKLAADFPAVPKYRVGLADSHNNLGILLSDLGKWAEAEAEYRTALAVGEKLAADFPAVPDYRRDLASSHSSLGNLLEKLGKRTEAEAAYRAALPIRERLAADFPAAPKYRADLASSHYNLGILLQRRGKRAEAEAAYRAALAIREKLAADFSAVPDYRRELARSHNNLGVLLRDLGKRAEVEAAYRAALAIRERLAADFPAVPDYRGDLARSHNNLGLLLGEQGMLAEGEAALRAALAIRERLAADFPSVPEYRQEVVTNHANLATLFARRGRCEEAAALAEKTAAEPRVTADNLYTCASALGIAVAVPDNAAADRHAARAVELLRQAIAKNYWDVPILPADPDFASLRRRADYSALLWDLAETPAETAEPSSPR